MKKIISSLILTLICLFSFSSAVLAQCQTNADCPSGQSCQVNNVSNGPIRICMPGGGGIEPQADPIFGQIEAPQGVAQLNDQDESGMGLILFISNIIKIATIVAGVWTMFNFIIAGFTYITSANDSGKIAKIGESLTNSVVGLVIIVASYTIAAIIGLLIFGDATYIISPQIPTAI